MSQARCGTLEPKPTHMSGQAFAHGASENPLELTRRKAGDLAQRNQIKIIVKVIGRMLKNTADASAMRV
jgi:hypothetical protein